MGLVTRQIGPDAKGSKLTFAEMDNNLYYLQGLGVSGLTYSANTLTITNPTGGTTSVNIASDTNTFITAATYNDLTNTITLTDNTNTSFNAYIDSVSGLTVNGILSATTYQNLPVSGLTAGSNINISGTNNNFTISVTGITSGGSFTGGTVTGSTTFTNGLTSSTISATTFYGDGSNLTGISGGTTSFLRNETNSGSTDTIKINESIFNPSNLTVLSTSIFIVDTNADYYVLGDLYNYGEIIVEGVLKVGGTIYNYGVITGSGIIE